MSSHNLYEYEATVLKIRKGYMDAAQGLCDDLREIAGEYIESITLDADTITIEWKQEIDFEMSGLERRAPCFKNTRPFWGRKSEDADDEFFWRIKDGRVITTGAISIPDEKHWQSWD